MNKYIIFFLTSLLIYNNAQAKDCPGNMILWKPPGMLSPDCYCAPGQRILTDLSKNSYRFGSCQESYNLYNSNFPFNLNLGLNNDPNKLLVLWLDADDPYGNGYRPPINTPINIWFDKSGFNNHATAPSLARSAKLTKVNDNGEGQPRYVLNFSPANSTYYTVSNSSGTNNNNLVNTSYASGLTIFLVTQPTLKVISGNPGILQKRLSSTYNGSYSIFQEAPTNSDDYSFIFERLTSPSYVSSLKINSAQISSFRLVVAQSNSTLNKMSIYFTSTPQSIQDTSTNVGTIVPNSAELLIGARGFFNTYNSYFTGNIAEIIIFYNVLPASQVTEIVAYLNQKWSIY